MPSEKDIEELIRLMDEKADSGVGRFNLRVDEGKGVAEVKHHGRCDVGSAWAKGTVTNPECVDIPDLEEE